MKWETICNIWEKDLFYYLVNYFLCVDEKGGINLCNPVFMASGIMVYLAESWNICFKYGSAANRTKCHTVTIFMNCKEVLTLGVLYACWHLHFIVRDT